MFLQALVVSIFPKKLTVCESVSESVSEITECRACFAAKNVYRKDSIKEMCSDLLDMKQPCAKPVVPQENLADILARK